MMYLYVYLASAAVVFLLSLPDIGDAIDGKRGQYQYKKTLGDCIFWMLSPGLNTLAVALAIFDGCCMWGKLVLLAQGESNDDR